MLASPPPMSSAGVSIRCRAFAARQGARRRWPRAAQASGSFVSFVHRSMRVSTTKLRTRRGAAARLRRPDRRARRQYRAGLKTAQRLADTAAAYTLNNYCVSSLTAIGQAAAMVSSGQMHNALAGGVEMMSRVPFMADSADYYTDATMPERSRYIPVALAADRLAEDEGIDRAALDACALRSQQRAAIETRRSFAREFRCRPDGTALAVEECVRPQTTAASLAAMQPAFAELANPAALGRRVDHRHTFARAPVCDGASLALVGDGNSSRRPRARIVAYAECGGDPYASLLAGSGAMEKVLKQAGMQLRDVDCIEFMESFAVTIAKFLRDRDVDPERVNVAGGHLAKVHPMGASGGILLSTLLDVLEARGGTTGLVVASGAAGVGAAMLIERC